jgi:NAD-dependent histone deacetylase SIR2
MSSFSAQSPSLPRVRRRIPCPSSIPTLRGFDACQRPLVDRIYQILPFASKVTVVVGAGISTHAGIPVCCNLMCLFFTELIVCLQDFRSENGIRNRTFGDRQTLRGSELFESRTLQDHGKRKVFNQEMARMRIACREAELTSCHVLVARLYDAKQLVRCYTQNIDGLQTRDRQDMEEVVFELHGTNVHIKCGVCNRRPIQPPSDFDEQLLSNGYAACPTCLANPAREFSICECI